MYIRIMHTYIHIYDSNKVIILTLYLYQGIHAQCFLNGGHLCGHSSPTAISIQGNCLGSCNISYSSRVQNATLIGFIS